MGLGSGAAAPADRSLLFKWLTAEKKSGAFDVIAILQFAVVIVYVEFDIELWPWHPSAASLLYTSVKPAEVTILYC